MVKRKKALIIVLLIGIAVIAVALIWQTKGSSGVNANKSTVSDAQTIQDLYTLELAINHYFDTTSTANGPEYKLPASLSDLRVTNLKGKLSDYQYNYTSQTTGGGPTVSYELCATFKKAGNKSDEYVGTVGGTSNAYKSHKKGKQCFKNDFYKGVSHVYPKR